MPILQTAFYVAVGFAAGFIYRRYQVEKEGKKEPVIIDMPAEARKARAAAAPAQGELEEIQIMESLAKSTPEPKPTSSAIRRDDLTKVKGIGPVFAERFYEAGINTFADLAALTAEQAREISGLKSWQAADPAEWVEQARGWAS